ncbi:cytosolic carboxypeptidase 6-like [Sycon ciliatum]|uniref:cytosolic carboxypeptidase 6-like n=1 Tax=Sycon ciliatum TaxID=27933 RepID=UPI0031F640C3|eukprot:scpid33350/ scgid0631/ Cytosolic carboxypeptidase 6; ATP/GTP-binding protein-like 4
MASGTKDDLLKTRKAGLRAASAKLRKAEREQICIAATAEAQQCDEEIIERLLRGKETVGNLGDCCPAQKDKSKRVQGQLVFDGCFESGNLGRVDIVSPIEYDIYIRPDTCNGKYTVWFYFSVTNTHPGQDVIFSFVNQSKTKSLYRHGMAPCVFSTSRPLWMRIPDDRAYYYQCPDHNDHYVLSVLFNFDRAEDTYWFAYCFPYTHSDLLRYLGELDDRKFPFYRRESLTKTTQGRHLDLLTITNPNNLEVDEAQDPKRKIPAVVITARVHPGETPSSYVCDGVINFLISDDELAVSLRNKVIFYIVPMLNPDGVFLGNYRCSMHGYDLNRVWNETDAEPWMHPTIDAVRDFVHKISLDPRQHLHYVFDLHAHTTLCDAFIYGNEFDDETRTEMQSHFPKKLSTRSKDFSLEKTHYNCEEYKAGTARRYLGGVHPRLNAYTVEISCYGYINKRDDSVIGYTPESYEEFGANLARTFGDVFRLRS